MMAGGLIGQGKRHLDREATSLQRLGADSTLVRLGDGFHDRKTEAEAAVGPVQAIGVAPMERKEQLLDR
jgi:hypothetical protein